MRLAGALDPDGVIEQIELADVLVMPCIVAVNGDRDSAPLVVKEALALERLVVASDEVGLPEFVKEPWGVLHAPGEAAGLARALAEALAHPADERERRGALGRAFVAEAADVHREAAALSALIAKAGR